MVLEGAGKEQSGGQNEKEHRKSEERQYAKPCREIAAAHQRSYRLAGGLDGQKTILFKQRLTAMSSEAPGLDLSGDHLATETPTTLSQCLAVVSLAAACCSSVGNTALV